MTIKHIVLPLLIAFALPMVANAAVLTQADQTALAATGQRYFGATVNSDRKAIAAMTTPNFQVISLEGQSLGADDLFARWQRLSAEYGTVMAHSKLTSVTSTGNTVVGTFVTRGRRDVVANGPVYVTSTVNAVHQLTFVNVGGVWKIASDRVINRSLL